MSVTFEHPIYFLLFLLPIPILLFVLLRFRTTLRLLKNYIGTKGSSVRSVKIRFAMRSLFLTLAWCCISIAFVGPSWGTEMQAVQKSGSAVSMVFDISYSMNAKDSTSKNGTERLEAVKEISENLLSYLPGVAVSGVLAKGEGLLAVPLTEDYYAMINLIQALSPTMISTPGSSLASGIEAAIGSFPPQSARSSYILVFTDGDETDEGLEAAVQHARDFGITVVFVGFGTENNIEVIAGDGITKVKTSLKAEKLRLLANLDGVEFVLANNDSVLEEIISVIHRKNIGKGGTTTSYEAVPIKQYDLFIQIAFIFFVLGIFVSSISIERISNIFMKQSKIFLLLFVVIGSSIFSGCSLLPPDTQDILEGTMHWRQKNYNKAVANFLAVHNRGVLNEDESMQYALFGLSSSYLMQGELDASLSKINEMAPSVLPSLDFARWYNKGHIFHQKGEYAIAAFCFKKALLIDKSNIDAKINLEICLNANSIQSKQGLVEKIPVSHSDSPQGAADAIFSLIQENEDAQWKSSDTAVQESDVIDY